MRQGLRTFFRVGQQVFLPIRILRINDGFGYNYTYAPAAKRLFYGRPVPELRITTGNTTQFLCDGVSRDHLIEKAAGAQI